MNEAGKGGLCRLSDGRFFGSLFCSRATVVSASTVRTVSRSGCRHKNRPDREHEVDE